MFIYKQMDYYFDFCVETIQNKSKRKRFQSLSHNEPEKCMRTKHTTENPAFFDIDLIINEYITDHNKKFKIYFVKKDSFQFPIVNFILICNLIYQITKQNFISKGSYYFG